MSDKPRVDRHQVLRNGFTEDLHIPVEDFTAPKKEDLMKMHEFIDNMIEKDNPVGVSCGAGRGRTGTVLACYLVKHGTKAEDAIRRIGTLETDEQRNAVREFRP